MAMKFSRTLFPRVVAGVDWGYTNPGVLGIWGIDHDGRMYLVREYYRTQKLIGWWVERAVECRDTFGVEAFVCDPSEPGFIEQFRMAGLHAIQANNDISVGIQAVQARLVKAGDGRPRLFILKDAVVEADEELIAKHEPACTADEFDVYMWPKSQDGRSLKEKPLPKNDHGLDALRYVCVYLDLTPDTGAPEAGGSRSSMDTPIFRESRPRRAIEFPEVSGAGPFF